MNDDFTVKILFVCHGNICRSPLAEFVMKDLVRRRGLEERFCIASAATSTEEIGNDVYPPTKRSMDAHGVPYEKRAARQLRRDEVQQWDYLIGMDDWNIRNMRRIVGAAGDSKIRKLMEFAEYADDGAGAASMGGVDGAASGGDARARARAASAGMVLVPDVADPWYTGDFEITYQDVLAGCTGLLAYVQAVHGI